MTNAVIEASTVRKAIRLATPFAELLVKNGLTKKGRNGIHVVVAQPSSMVTEPVPPLRVEQTIGELDDEHDYVKIAQGKTEVTLRAEKPSAEVSLAERQPGDPIYWGSIWNADLKLAIGASGFQPEYDRLVCQAVEAILLLMMEQKVDLGQPATGNYATGDFLVPA